MDPNHRPLQMKFDLYKEDGIFWAAYEDDHYGFTTARGNTMEELKESCQNAAACLLEMEKGGANLVPVVWFSPLMDLTEPHQNSPAQRM